MEKGILISSELLEKLPQDFDHLNFFNQATKKLNSKLFVINENLIKEVLGDKYFDNIPTEQEIINSDDTASIIVSDKQYFNKTVYPSVKIIKSYNEEEQKRDVQCFVNHFKNRYEVMRKILISRQDLQESVSIIRLSRKNEREKVSVIGIVLDKQETKNGNIKLTIEDPTGVIMVLVNKTKEEIFNLAKDIVNDEVIGVSGAMGKNILFCNSLYFPDIPLNHELKKSPDEAYAVFISDIHFGIKNFISTDFLKFIAWLKGEFGNEIHREIARKVKYLFITGDIVEGIGIYPGQEEDLEIKDIYEQYEEATKYFKMIPENIQIIICAGNHDAVRMSEPQPKFDKHISKGFYEIPNLNIVSNPAIVNIHSSENFPGFNILMYHGFSFPYYADNVPSLRNAGGIFRCDLIMKYLLQKRHLAPAHGSNQYIPDPRGDNLIIDLIPDVFVSGHLHQITVSNYRNITLINSACWVVQSADNAKRGIVPNPAKVPILNLKTRQVKIMNFLSDDVKVLLSERIGVI